MKRRLLFLFIASIICNLSYADEIITLENTGINNSDSLYRKIYPKATLETFSIPSENTISIITDNLKSITRFPVQDYGKPNNNLYVGEIEINSGQTPTGGKTYDIPIKLPLGMNNFKPEISISYNSQRKYSLLGTGWDIEGDSKITFGAQTLYYDGNIRSVSNDCDDAFFLDGMRLLKIKTDTNDVWYQTESGNIKLKALKSNNNFTEFKVYYPNGNVGIYKRDYTSILIYNLLELVDLWGNKIVYNRDTNGLLTTIEYNGNTIEFNYIERQDQIIEYLGGGYIYNLKLISEINVKYNNEYIRSYTFSYDKKFGVEQLTEINLSEGKNKYNPLCFFYGNNDSQENLTFYNSDSQLIRSYRYTSPESIRVVSGKFDYENDTNGIIILPNESSFWVEGSNEKYFVNKYDTPDANNEILIYTNLKDSYSDLCTTIKTEEGFIDILAADIHGDREERIVKINNILSNGKDVVK